MAAVRDHWYDHAFLHMVTIAERRSHSFSVSSDEDIAEHVTHHHANSHTVCLQFRLCHARCPGAAAAGVLAVLIYQKDLNQESLMPEAVEHAMNQLTGDKDEHHLVNWSNTHECRPKRFYQPETQEELEAIVREAHEKGLMPISL